MVCKRFTNEVLFFRINKEGRIDLDVICFIETAKSGSSFEAIKIARKNGYKTVLFTARKSFLQEKNRFPEITQIVYVNQLAVNTIRDELTQLQQSNEKIKAIVSFIDPFVSMAARLMNDYCGTTISVDALEIMEDKAETRITVLENSANPKFHVIHPCQKTPDISQLAYPFIIKLAKSSASRDVYVVQNQIEMEKKLFQLNTLYPQKKILLEEYLKGPQYAVEVLVHEGHINIVAIVKQHMMKRKKFIVTGYEVQLDFSEVLLAKLKAVISSTMTALNAKNVACHVEMRLVDGDWKLIEINPRIAGGAMNRIIEEAYGIHLAEETMKLYMGEKFSIIPKFKNEVYAHFLTMNTVGRLLKVAGVEKALNSPNVLEVFIKPRIGNILMPAVSMGQRYGFVLATGNCAEEARVNAFRAARELKFYVEPI